MQGPPNEDEPTGENQGLQEGWKVGTAPVVLFRGFGDEILPRLCGDEILNDSRIPICFSRFSIVGCQDHIMCGQCAFDFLNEMRMQEVVYHWFFLIH